MNEGAACFHSGIKMDFTTEDRIVGVIQDIKRKMGKDISLFYGLSVSVRYAVRSAEDLVRSQFHRNYPYITD